MTGPTPTHSAEPGLSGVSGSNRDPGDAVGEMSAQRWRPVLGYEGLYEVSDLGLVRIAGQARPLTATHWGAYLAVTLRGRGRPKRARVHVVVLEAFVSPRPDGMVARHLNDQQSDNRLANLAWGTPERNREDARRNRDLNRVSWSEFHASRSGRSDEMEGDR